ncbi:nuclear transport factor 2 family protein [Cyclobacterium roseum]|uniref:nuclear transport factor 2 family protein n=1 Tax=Cyclobacterium roseum TaxID=2666137 RepID=UPI0013918B32|nr:nuclear transport factor 2 family protein [Cyclobacterium roseum]
MKKRYILILFIGLMATGCVSSSSNGEIDESETEAVLDHHWETFINNDLEGVMEDYTEESILITPNGTYSGLEEIRGNFVNAFKAFPSQGADLTLNQSLAVKDVGYILWEANTPEFNLTYATDTFIIRNGKILRQTYAGVRVGK